MRVKMDQAARAKQFMPFAALKGYEEALRAKEKIVVPKAELSEEMKDELDYCMAHLQRLDMVKIVFFHKGEYLETSGVISRLDKDARIIEVVDRKISFEDIYRMERL